VGACIVLVFCANTINVGADLGAVAAGGSLLTGSRIQSAWFLVPVALLIGVMQLRLSYSTIFRSFKYLTLALFAYVVTVFIVHPQPLATVEATFVPHFEFTRTSSASWWRFSARPSARTSPSGNRRVRSMR
jgi:Mn2+/Fe2+ NRAMP family transporter